MTVKKLQDVGVVAGRLIPVTNTDKKKFSNANEEYFSMWVEDYDGGNERCLLFTENEILNAEHRASRNKEDLTSKSWMTDIQD